MDESDVWDVEEILKRILKTDMKAIADNKAHVEFLKSILQKRLEMGMEPPITAVPILIRQLPEEIVPERFKSLKYEDFHDAVKWMFEDEEARKHLEKALLHTTGATEYTHDNPYLEHLLNSAAFENMRILDIGTATGVYTKSLLEEVKNPIKSLVRTNLAENIKITQHPWQKDKIPDYREIKPFNIVTDVLPEKFDIVIFKDVSKFLHKEGLKRAMENIKKMTDHGSIVIYGGEIEASGHARYVGFSDGKSAIRILVNHNGKLVEVDPERFIKEVAKVKSREEYLQKLPSLIAKHKIRKRKPK